MAGLFGTAGFIYPFAFTVAASVMGIASREGGRGGAEHEAGELLWILLLWGGVLFAGLWAWIGHVMARDARRGWVMWAASVVLGTLGLWVCGALPVNAVLHSNAGRLAALLFLWAAMSALSAWLGQRIPVRRKP